MRIKKTRRSRGIWVRGYVPMLIFILALCVTIYLYIGISGLTDSLMENSDQTTQSILQARTDYVSNSMTQRWSEMTSAIQDVTTIYDELVNAKGYTIEEVIAQENLYVEFLNTAINPVIDVLRRNTVTGAYIVLADKTSVTSGQTLNLPGIFLRDRDPMSAYNNNNRDLLFERAPISVVHGSGISTDTYWVPNFTISENRDLSDAFYKPYFAALENPTANSTGLSYWSITTEISNSSSDSFFFSAPLVSSSGEVFGVIGIDVLKSYFSQSIPHEELANGDGAYAIYKTQDDGSISFVESFSKTGKYPSDFWQGLTFDSSSNSKIFSYTYGERYNVQISQFKLYDSNSPFADEKWYICAVLPYNIHYQTAIKTMRSISFFIILFTVVTIVGVGIILYRIASPIKHLEQQLKSTQSDCDDLKLDSTGISELDVLANTVEKLHSDIRATAGKFSQLLEMSSIKMGAFEFNKDTNNWFISHNFFGVFDENNQQIDLDLNTTLEKLDTFKSSAIPETIIETDEIYDCVCELAQINKLSNFVRIKILTTDDYIRGFVEDVSIEWQEIRKLAYERNHDNLTDIYNRRGFYEQYYSLMKLPQSQLKISAVVMLDLDNLKILNDTYGHDIGDKYICTTAKVLKRHSSNQVIVSRISGDEFLVFLHGYDTQEECDMILAELENDLASEQICISENHFYSLHVSAGVAYCPTDSTQSNQLVQFADFAMYQGKRSIKGRFIRFDRSIYEQEELRIKSKEALNNIIDGNTIQFFFQPIFCARTGEIFAYEALMRPQNELLRSPLDVLRVARQENRLGDIEVMTFFNATKSFVYWCEKGVIKNPNCKLFINTITTETLSEEQLEFFEDDFSDYLSRLVVEYTEEEQADAELLVYKTAIVEKWGGAIALDDYGSGYNGESMLLGTDVKYIKLDMGMIKNIHIDNNRRQRVHDLLNYAHSRGITVLAEGVEIEEEFLALQELGVDLFQGYYLGRPAFEPPNPNLDDFHFPERQTQI